MYEGSSCFTSLTTLDTVSHFKFNHFSGSVVICQLSIQYIQTTPNKEVKINLRETWVNMNVTNNVAKGLMNT